MPDIVVDNPGVNVNEKIEIQNGERVVEQKNEKPRDVIVNDKFEINQKNPEIVVDYPGVNVNDKIEIKQPEIVVEKNDLSGITNAISISHCCCPSEIGRTARPSLRVTST